MSATKLKLKKGLALENFVKSLAQKGIMEVKELTDYQSHKLNPQLTSDLMNFIEKQVSNSEFSKKDINKKELLKEILKACFELTEEELNIIEKMVNYAIENEIVKPKTFFSRFMKGARKLGGLVGRLLF